VSEDAKPGGGLFQALRPLNRASSIRDALAGVQLAAMNIPQALGYTKIAGMPVVTGFYTLLLPMVAFAAFGSSRYLVVAADSATAAILAGGLAFMAPLGSPEYVMLAGLVAMITAALLLIARIMRLGFLADFLSQTVLVGFLTGVGFQVGIAVLGEMLGLEITARRTVVQLEQISHNLSHVHWPTVELSAVVVVGVLLLRRLSKQIPASFLAVIGAIAASYFLKFAGRGITVIGPVAGGLPHLGLPHATLRQIESVMALSASCFVMIVAQSAATARFYAERHQQHLDENRDLVGLAAANAAASLSGAFVVNGSPTQTALVENSGGRSQLAQMSTAVVVALVLMFLTRPLAYLPRCVLGSIVFLIAIRLIDLKGLASIRRESPAEYAVAVSTAAVVVLVGVEQGILFAMALSLVRIVKHSYRPHSGVLAPPDGDRFWRLLPATPGAMTEPGVAIYRFGAPLFYANAGRFAEEVRAIAETQPAPRWVIVDAEAISNCDYTASRMLTELQHELVQRNVTLAFARVGPYLKADLDRHHVTNVIGARFIFPRMHDAVAACHESAN